MNEYNIKCGYMINIHGFMVTIFGILFLFYYNQQDR